jgi:hypothetical protein
VCAQPALIAKVISSPTRIRPPQRGSPTGALAVTTAVGSLSVLVAGVLSGLAFFGAHPFHVVDAPTLSTGVAVTRVLAASGFTLLCMLSIAAIAFALGLWLPRGAAELGTGELAQVGCWSPSVSRWSCSWSGSSGINPCGAP